MNTSGDVQRRTSRPYSVIAIESLQLPPQLRFARDSLVRSGLFSYRVDDYSAVSHQNLFYGPYIPLRAGFYSITLVGEMVGEFELRLTADVGQRTLMTTRISRMGEPIVFGSESDIANFEVLILKTPNSRSVQVTEIRLTHLEPHDVLGQGGLLPNILRELRDLQTLPPESNRGIQAGRNIMAGYLRGNSLALGLLTPFIKQDPDWIAAMEASRGRSIVVGPSLTNLFLILKYSNLQGNIIEYGAFRGGSAIFMATLLKRLNSPYQIFALDTFSGMPDCDPVLDAHRAGNFADTDFEELERLRLELKLDNLHFLKGLFQDTVEAIPMRERRFALSHVDCDIYQSVKFSIDFSKRYAIPGSYFIFDDPLVHDCIGAMQAVEEGLVQAEGVFAEQAYPHLVYRYPPLVNGSTSQG